MSGTSPEYLVRQAKEAGLSLDEIATALREAGIGPIEAIKALRDGAEVLIGEGKLIVDRSLPPVQRAATERLRDVAERAILESED